MSEQYVRVPRELLERVETWVQADCQALTELQALLAAPAEDVRAVVDEPVAWRGCNSDGEVVTEWVDGAPPAKMFDLQGNAASFGKIELAYSHPQRPVVVDELEGKLAIRNITIEQLTRKVEELEELVTDLRGNARE